MIPLRLHIKNFLSYGSPVQTIDFEPYHLICLAGKNGHGKSALLDAITWSLWGQARKVASAVRSDANLLRLGHTTMMVALDFKCNNRVYRVRREYHNEDAKNMTYLDFGIYDEETQQWRQLTTKSMRETQELIVSIIGLDGEAFENSAFLRQGHSDEFSRKSPKDRKEMLATILGLSAYELLRKKALDRGKEEQIRYHNSVRSCELLRLTIAPHQQAEHDLVQVQQEYAQVTAAEQQLLATLQQNKKELHGLYHERQGLSNALALAHHKEEQVARTTDELRTLWQQWREVRRRYAACMAQPLQGDRAALLHELATIQEKLHNHREMAQRMVVLKDDMHRHRTARQHEYEAARVPLAERKNALEQQRSIAQHEVQRLRAQQAEVAKNLDKLVRAHQNTLVPDAAVQYEAALRAIELLDEKARVSLTKATLLLQRVTRDGERAQEEQGAFTSTSEPVCLSCFQPIAANYLPQIATCRQRQRARYAHQKKRLEAVTLHYRMAVQGRDAELQKLKEQHKEATLQQTRYEAFQVRHKELLATLSCSESELKSAVATGEKAEHDVRAVDDQLAALRDRHDAGVLHDTLLREGEGQLQVYEGELRTADAVHDAYTRVQTQLARIAEEEVARARVLQEMHTQKERTSALKKLCQELRMLRQQQAATVQLRAHAAALETRIGEAERKEHLLQQDHSALQHKKELLASQQGALEQALRHSNQQTQLLEEEKKRVKIHEDNVTDYNLLVQILGKDGIQGMLIEHILPEIEQEANALLARLTDNQAQLRFESLRGLKSGVLKETLDIKIADSLGTRPYELFSGGEAFRIDFALRLAISKLLARRAGASIQTLIIDEGFGSQDEEGLSHIMECLYAIQDEFAKIIIVSHLPVMKDQFPTHFYIHKGMQGSTVHLVEQG